MNRAGGRPRPAAKVDRFPGTTPATGLSSVEAARRLALHGPDAMALSAMSAPAARVVRDGEERSVAAAEVVPGDVVLVAEGDIVPADGDVLAAALLLADESSLTGESIPVEKVPGSDEALGAVSAGTVIVRSPTGRSPACCPASAMSSCDSRRD
ncbi:P-type ATPase [Streptomyces afghaniensis]|uniref:P-type ATPase n=1 Tax=Streptomyces afghaniensis TaxID=66865 RepID=UPI00278560D3|nr:hypothetical protein [Streptomyces afghaniensis]MDQ1013963.1 magnesium-transporting ATPase (P-type) [Streptomyces afghaniensis]